MQKEDKEMLRRLLLDVGLFSQGLYRGHGLRSYQLAAVRAVAEAVEVGQGGSFVWVFSRQAGKDEALAQLLAYLLHRHSLTGGQIIVAAPTARQAQISRDRLVTRLNNWLSQPLLKERDGYIVSLGRANARFLSAAPSANVRGETASLLLVANETQDIEPERWDAVFDPMAASTNAVTLYLGTVWSSHTLLARQMRHVTALERADGQRRQFLVDWREVAAVLPAYGERVRERIRQFGPEHPFIRTEYELKELDGAGGLFNPTRRALMLGSHSRQLAAEPGKIYCLLVDVAGEDEDATSDAELRAANPRKDSTAVTVVEVDTSSFKFQVQSSKLEEGLPKSSIANRQSSIPHPSVLPTYRVVQRYVWTGVKQTTLYTRLLGLANETWKARYVVVDATGIGAGLASFLERALPRKVIPFVFSSVSKSELGWNFLAVVDSGRFKDYLPDGAEDTSWWWRQLEAVEYEVRPGPGKLMRWGVPDPTLHDDLVISAALVSVLDEQEWRSRRAVGIM